MHNQQDSDQFTVLENRRIGRNIALYRKLKDKKAMEVAEYIGIGEAAYTKYERGETKMTIDLIQKVSEFLKIDPISLISESPSTFIESHGNNSPTSLNTRDINYHGPDKELLSGMLKMMENMILISQKLVEKLDKEK